MTEKNGCCSVESISGPNSITFNYDVAVISQPGFGFHPYFNNFLCQWHFDDNHYHYLMLIKKDFFMYHNDSSSCSCNDHLQVDYTTPIARQGSGYVSTHYICGPETYYDPKDINKFCKGGVSTCLPSHVGKPSPF